MLDLRCAPQLYLLRLCPWLRLVVVDRRVAASRARDARGLGCGRAGLCLKLDAKTWQVSLTAPRL